MAIRTFLSVDLDGGARDALARDVERLRAGVPRDAVKWTEPAQWHVTLRFLGDVDEERVDALGEALARALSTERAFGVVLEGAGCFPSTEAPRVAWAGLREDAGRAALLALQRRVESVAEAMGFPPADHPFSPHLTVGRIAREVPRSRALLVGEAVRAWMVRPIALSVDTVHVMESRRSDRGAVHVERRRVALG